MAKRALVNGKGVKWGKKTKKIMLFNLEKVFQGIVAIDLNDEELRAFNLIHHALMRNGYAYVLQKIEIRRSEK